MAGCLCLFCLWPQVSGVFGGFGSQGCVLCAFADKMLLVGFLSCGTAIFSFAICCNFNFPEAPVFEFTFATDVKGTSVHNMSLYKIIQHVGNYLVLI